MDRKPKHTVVIVGSGPSGFYAAEALLASGRAAVHMYERLPFPFGLVRYGVAPDHPRLKEVTTVFERIAQHPDFRFLGNVTIGLDLSVTELRQGYTAVVLAYGAESDTLLNVLGEDLSGVHGAREFVAWYNGHPDYADRDFFFDVESAAIVGNGNVALDVARILLTPVDVLRGTDISPMALEQLSRSRIETVHIVGRRGAAQARFSDKELREFTGNEHFDACLAEPGAELTPACEIELSTAGNASAVRTFAALQALPVGPRRANKRRAHFHFLRTPLGVVGTNRANGLVLQHNRLWGAAFAQTAQASAEKSVLGCGLVLRSIGSRSLPFNDVPFDCLNGRVPSIDGRVTTTNGALVAGLYVTGWARRGPTGIIGTNRACGREVAASILHDLPTEIDRSHLERADSMVARLESRGVESLSFDDWRYLDALERAHGRALGRPRIKFVSRETAFSALRSRASGAGSIAPSPLSEQR